MCRKPHIEEINKAVSTNPIVIVEWSGCIFLLSCGLVLVCDAILTRLEVGLLNSAAGERLNLDAACKSSSYTGLTQNCDVSRDTVSSSVNVMQG